MEYCIARRRKMMRMPANANKHAQKKIKMNGSDHSWCGPL